MVSDNKHQSTRIRKKFRKNPPYRCCYPPTGNPTKYAKFSCTYPQAYRRRDNRVWNERTCRELFHDQELLADLINGKDINGKEQA